MKVNDTIVTEEWDSNKTHVTEPRGITFLDGNIYVTDMKAGSIVVLDRNGNFQYQSSDSELFLFEPTVIKTDGKLLYVIDSGNYQLKILSKDLELIEVVKLPDKYPEMNYWDLEIVDEKIYLTPSSMFEEYTAIYELGKSGELYKKSQEFFGYFSVFNNELMVVNSFETYKKEEYGIETIGGKSGKNSLYRMINDELKQEFEFVNKYAPLDFIRIGNFIYVVSSANRSLDKFTADGRYIETLFIMDKTGLFVQLEYVDDSILIVFPTKKTIYKVNIR